MDNKQTGNLWNTWEWMCAMDKNKVLEGNNECSSVSGGQGRSDDQIAFDWRSKGGQGVNHEGKNFPGRESSQCKGPGVGEGLACTKNSKETIVAEME